jgi:hypothetical protein
MLACVRYAEATSMKMLIIAPSAAVFFVITAERTSVAMSQSFSAVIAVVVTMVNGSAEYAIH